MTIPETGFLRFKQVQGFFPVSRTTWYRGIRSGRFPKPIMLGPKTVVWKAEDIRALIEKAREGKEWPAALPVPRRSSTPAPAPKA